MKNLSSGKGQGEKNREFKRSMGEKLLNLEKRHERKTRKRDGHWVFFKEDMYQVPLREGLYPVPLKENQPRPYMVQ